MKLIFYLVVLCLCSCLHIMYQSISAVVSHSCYHVVKVDIFLLNNYVFISYEGKMLIKTVIRPVNEEKKAKKNHNVVNV